MQQRIKQVLFPRPFARVASAARTIHLYFPLLQKSLHEKEQLESFKKGGVITEVEYRNLPEEYEDLITVEMGATAIKKMLDEFFAIDPNADNSILYSSLCDKIIVNTDLNQIEVFLNNFPNSFTYKYATKGALDNYEVLLEEVIKEQK